MLEFKRIKRLPPYVFAIVNQLKMDARRKGEDIIDLGMGNPDMPTLPLTVTGRRASFRQRAQKR